VATDRVLIFDTTLRDGEQGPGFSMHVDEKLALAQATPPQLASGSRRAISGTDGACGAEKSRGIRIRVVKDARARYRDAFFRCFASEPVMDEGIYSGGESVVQTAKAAVQISLRRPA
jgi:hypothetical protein